MSTTIQSSSLWTRLSCIVLLLNSLLVMPVAAQQQYLQQTYCSSDNTGSSNLVNTTIYQSLGNCQGKCRGSYAFGIVQGKDCWCSNNAPSDQQPTSDCSDSCFGYPYENCGSQSKNLFGYIAGDAVIGQQSSSSSASSQSTSTSLRTSGGTVYTATVTLLPTGASNSAGVQKKSSGLFGGAIAGIVIGVIVGVIALIAAIVCFLAWRRRRYDAEEGEGGLMRSGSVLSRSMLGGSRGTNGNPYSTNNSTMQERRNSQPLVTDQRLNPGAFMQHDDGSRSSFVSMQDNRDYTRTLNVRNPDTR